MNKRGMTLIEVIVTITILSIVLSGLLTLYSFLISLQIKREDTWKATKIVENIHAEYLANPEIFNIGNEIIYYSDNLDVTTKDNYYFIVEYELTKDKNIYHLVIIKLVSKGHTLYTNFDLGVWCK